MWVGFTVVYHATADRRAVGHAAALSLDQRLGLPPDGVHVRAVDARPRVHNTFFFTVGNVPEFVREGRFDRFLVRPLDTLFQAITVPQQIWPDELILASSSSASRRLQRRRRRRALSRLRAARGDRRRLIDFGITLPIATVSFWFIRIDTLRWVVMSLEQDFSRYPIRIYTRGVQVVLAFVLPFAFMNYFPATFLLHKTDDGLHSQPGGRPADARRRRPLERRRLRLLARRAQPLPGHRQLVNGLRRRIATPHGRRGSGSRLLRPRRGAAEPCDLHRGRGGPASS